MDYLKYIEYIKENSIGEFNIMGKKCLLIDDMYVNLWTDKENYLNGLQFLKKGERLWTWSNPLEFKEKYLNNKLEFIEYSIRNYGEPKLSKPKELKGIKQTYSIEYIPKKCRCQVFVNNNDVWIKQGDYFSPALEVEPEDIGAPLKFLVDKYVGENSRKAKFVYDDTWGSIVLRREAWICIKNLVSQKAVLSPAEIVHEILRQQEKKSRFNFRENELEHTDISRFYEKLMLELFK